MVIMKSSSESKCYPVETGAPQRGHYIYGVSTAHCELCQAHGTLYVIYMCHMESHAPKADTSKSAE